MIEVTPKAREQIREILASQDEADYCIRLSITGRGASGFEYELTLLQEKDKQDGDVRVDADDFTLLVDGEHVSNLQGAKLDFVEQQGGMGFKIDNPNPLWTDSLSQRVQRVLDEEINPGVAAHGGHVTLLDVRDAKAYIQLGGGCQGCGMADVTLKQGIETAIKKSVPEVVEVLDTTDHAAGANPYYQPTKGGASPFA